MRKNTAKRERKNKKNCYTIVLVCFLLASNDMRNGPSELGGGKPDFG